jgi:hypothetical protein
VRSTKNGCWTRSEVVDLDNVDGDLAIVSSYARGLAVIAANVVAESRNNPTNCGDTGATVLVNRSSALRNPVSWVEGSDKYAATGLR